jgi:acyl-CoA oxidase
MAGAASPESVNCMPTTRRAQRECFSNLTWGRVAHMPGIRFEGDNFVLDQQVVRAGLKSYKNFISSPTAVITDLSPSTYYLRLLRQDLPSVKSLVWIDQYETTVELLEWRAALLVRERFVYLNEPDASMDQRVYKAVSEAFVANQVSKMIKDLNESMPKKERKILCDVYMLVRSCFFSFLFFFPVLCFSYS